MRKFRTRYIKSSRALSLDSYFLGTPNGLNLIRGLLASMVCISHVGWIYGQDNMQIRSLGVYSVAIFFGISGFLIHESSVKSKGLSQFARNRVKRIFPAYILVLCSTALLYYPIYEYLSRGEFINFFTTDQILYILKNLSLHIVMPQIGKTLSFSNTHVWNPSLWTLEYEFIMYFLCYILSKTLKNQMRFFAPVMMILFSLIANFQTQKSFYFEFFYLAQFFFLGVTVCQFRKYIYIKPSTFAVLSLGAVISYAVLQEFSITSALLILLSLILGIKLQPAKLRNADYSYGIYLHAGPITHLVVLIIKKAQIPLLVGYILSLIFSIAAGYVSWNLIESRFSNRKPKSKDKIDSA